MFPEFIYEDFKYDVQSDGLHIAFSFRLKPQSQRIQSEENFVFHPSAVIPSRTFLHPERLPKGMLDNLVFNIGMIELVSYWKCFCSPNVTVVPPFLSENQLPFWKKIYFNGLGEFFYTNCIAATEDDFMSIHIQNESNAQTDSIYNLELAEQNEIPIVPIGGGKDSVVTLDLLGGIPLIMNPRGATISCIEKAGFTMDDVIVINRHLDPLMLDFNKKGALNGHTPFSAMLAFYTLLASALTGQHFRIALSNESSANESTVSGTKVNHQYSKSLEFENDFRKYVSEFISPDFNYFSFLRPLSELQIAMLFSQLEHYHAVFRSCNVGSKEDIWCGHCAKCLFAYIILSPFISPDKLNAIFGKNMLDDISLKHEFQQLIGKAETKPFECVGTVDEVNCALGMSISRWYSNNRPALLSDYECSGCPKLSLSSLLPSHNVPAEYLEKLNSEVKKNVLMQQSLDKLR